MTRKPEIDLKTKDEIDVLLAESAREFKSGALRTSLEIGFELGI